MDGAIRRVALDGGTPRTVAEYDEGLQSATWSETDEILFSTAFPPGVYSVAATGGVPRRHEVLDSVARMGGAQYLHFAPEDGALFFSRPDSVFALATADDLRGRAIVRGSKAWYVPSGHLVYVSDGALFWQQSDIPEEQLIASRLTVSNGEMAVERRDVLFRFPGYVYTGHAQYDVSPDGQRFAIVRGTVESQVIVALDMMGR